MNAFSHEMSTLPGTHPLVFMYVTIFVVFFISCPGIKVRKRRYYSPLSLSLFISQAVIIKMWPRKCSSFFHDFDLLLLKQETTWVADEIVFSI